jgi:hypothetical protein
VEYRAATPDGSKVFFTSDEPLTDDDTGGRDLWRYDVDAPARSRLTRLSIDNVPDDGHVPPVTGLLGVSDDGEWVYFLALGPLVPDMPELDQLAPSIYQWHAGRTRFVGHVRQNVLLEQRATGEPVWRGIIKTSRVTADGRYVLWTTRQGGQLDPRDHGACGGGPCVEIYVFDAQANGGAGEVWCASCDPAGGPSTGSSSFNVFLASGAALQSSHLNRPLSDDGRVFFHTPEQLLAADRNDASDVYEFNTASASLSLVSSGRADSRDSYFLESSASGDDVFFATRDRLTGWDVDESYDIYDARVGGGFPEPPRPRPACAGEACRDALRAAPPMRVAPSTSFHGAGNVRSQARKPGRRCRRGKVRKRVHGRVRCVRPHGGRRAQRAARGR